MPLKTVFVQAILISRVALLFPLPCTLILSAIFSFAMACEDLVFVLVLDDAMTLLPVVGESFGHT